MIFRSEVLLYEKCYTEDSVCLICRELNITTKAELLDKNLDYILLTLLGEMQV